MDGPRPTVMVGRVPHDHQPGRDPLSTHLIDGDPVHSGLCGDRRHDIVSARDAARPVDLDEVVGEQSRDPTRICAAHRVEQLELARNGIVHVAHGADRTAPTERARNRIESNPAATSG
jgi:hypothetical protein